MNQNSISWGMSALFSVFAYMFERKWNYLPWLSSHKLGLKHVTGKCVDTETEVQLK